MSAIAVQPLQPSLGPALMQISRLAKSIYILRTYLSYVYVHVLPTSFLHMYTLTSMYTICQDITYAWL